MSLPDNSVSHLQLRQLRMLILKDLIEAVGNCHLYELKNELNRKLSVLERAEVDRSA